MVKVKNRFEISDNEYHYTAGYYTTNIWVDSDTIIAARSKSHEISKSSGETVELVKVSLSTGEKTVLCNDPIGSSHVVYGNKIYYTIGKEIKMVDAQSGESKVIYKDEFFPGENINLSSPEITNDGKYLSVFVCRKDMPTVFIVINTVTGKAKKLCEKGFSAPFSTANHGMICPTDPDIIFFAHEGDTHYVSNRLWIYNAKTDKMYNVAKQKLDENGTLGDCFGHESWSPDGGGMYFVKYPVSPVPPKGICYVDIETKEIELLYSAYPYWHVAVSHDNKYLLSDTQIDGIDSQVVVIDRADNSETVVDTVKIKVHPCHPHPQMSPDNKKVIYTALNSEGRTCIMGSILE